MYYKHFWTAGASAMFLNNSTLKSLWVQATVSISIYDSQVQGSVMPACLLGVAPPAGMTVRRLVRVCVPPAKQLRGSRPSHPPATRAPCRLGLSQSMTHRSSSCSSTYFWSLWDFKVTFSTQKHLYFINLKKNPHFDWAMIQKKKQNIKCPKYIMSLFFLNHHGNEGLHAVVQALRSLRKFATLTASSVSLKRATLATSGFLPKWDKLETSNPAFFCYVVRELIGQATPVLLERKW